MDDVSLKENNDVDISEIYNGGQLIVDGVDVSKLSPEDALDFMIALDDEFIGKLG